VLLAERDALRDEVERLRAVIAADDVNYIARSFIEVSDMRRKAVELERGWRDQCDTLRTAKEAAESALAAERERAEANARDARRMDWLHNEAHALDWTDDGERRVIVADVGDEFIGETWREAIDAALAAQEVQ
jgi:hypothetical protein